ncbi:High frequency lysogenization protein HflD [hydrothermal vent metagenome]|uniref:High frequency lysogenization protein HflD n=1 Tax=hydrothermal vent metagenome TaxID=652676 RepID=A0A3B1AP94_9ZZZZ
MTYTVFDKTIALAGIYQAISIVYQVANSGMIDVHNFEVVISSLLNNNPDKTQDVYGDLSNLRSGFEVIQNQLGSSTQAFNHDINRYVVTILHLERKLSNNRNMLNSISRRLEAVNSQLEHFPVTHENVLANLADIYAETISTLSPRIMIKGEEKFLSQTNNANKIRALLLSGIRSAVLWRQVGGNRWQLLLKRKYFISESKRILQDDIPKVVN